MFKRKVLIPLDGSEFSQQILAQVSRFLNPTETELVLFRVGLPPHVEPLEPARITATQWITPMQVAHHADKEAYTIYASQVWEARLSRLESELKKEALALEENGFTVSCAVRFGEDPAQEILEFIKEQDIDLVAMTTHGRTGLRRLLFGSVAEAVLHHVSVPVMLLRPAEEEVSDVTHHAEVAQAL